MVYCYEKSRNNNVDKKIVVWKQNSSFLLLLIQCTIGSSLGDHDSKIRDILCRVDKFILA